MNKHGVITAAAAIVAGSLIVSLTACGQAGQKPADALAQRPRPAAETKVTRASSPGPAVTARTPASSPSQPAPTAAAARPAGPAQPASADRSIEVYANCTSPSFEPAQIRVSCADGGWMLENLVWTSWTAASATATGTLVYNDCTPSCAEGHFHQVPGTRVLLGDPQPAVSGQLVWTQLQENPWIPGYLTGPLHGAPFRLPTSPI